MNLREVSIRISKRLPHAIVLEHSDPLVLLHSEGKVTTIPECTIQRGFALGAESEAPMCYPPLTKEELLAATALAVENIWHRLRESLNHLEDHQIRTVITVSPHLDPESVCVGMYLMEPLKPFLVPGAGFEPAR